MKIPTTLLFLMVVNFSLAQSYEFTYDNSGNRTSRLVIYLSNNSATASQPSEENIQLQDSVSTQIAGINCIVYPNPTKGIVRIDILEELDEELYFSLTNERAQQIQSRNSSQKSITFDLSNYEVGIYLLLVQGKTRRSTLKIIKS